MKPKQIVTAIAVILCSALGVHLLMRSNASVAADTDDDAEAASPTVVSVQVSSLKRMTLHRYLDAYGTVMPAPATAEAAAANALLATPTAGVVASVNVVEGQQVDQGALLLSLNSSAMTAAAAEQEVARQQLLYAQHNTSLKNLQEAETQLALLRVTTPLAGTVTRVNVSPGAAVDLNTVVAEVTDLNRLVMNAKVSEDDATAVRAGEMVQVVAQPPVTATVSYVRPTVDISDGTVQVRAALPTGSGLRPGQFLRLRIVTGIASDCLAAPEASVVTDDDGHSVIALAEGNQAVQTPVQTGYREDGWVQVSGPGLKTGDAVVTVGAYGLPDKTRIAVVTPAVTRAPDVKAQPNPSP